MIKRDFSRTFLREGYDMREVLSFLADVERTITGQQEDPKKIVTAQQAEDIEFSVRLRGFNVDEVDMEIDRLIQVLQGLDRQREQAPLNAEQAETAAVPVQAAPSAPVAQPAQPTPTPAVVQMPQVPAGGAGAAGAALPERPAMESSAVPLEHAPATLPTTDEFISAPPVAIPDAEPMALPAEYADFGTQKAVDDILRSMTQSKEQ